MNRAEQLDETGIRADFDYLLRLAVALSGRPGEADDLVHSTYLKALIALPDGVQSRRAYLRRMLINLNNDSLRRRAVLSEVPTPDAQFAVPGKNPFPNVELRVDVEAALQKLPELTRHVLVLRYLEDLSVREIARLLGRSAGTVRRVSAEGTHRLARMLDVGYGKNGDEEP
ncbi:RNA polymerase sigma factor [Nakamurella silvestris]|nr:RNA polymerase sigma factor [Nakamurella silvestris]